MRIVTQGWDTLDLSKLDINQPAKTKLSLHNMYYPPSATKAVS